MLTTKEVMRKIDLKPHYSGFGFDQEWLLTNGLGGYSSMAINGAPTRKYHGLLVAALPTPYGRTIMLNFIRESVELNGQRHVLTQVEHDDEKNKVLQEVSLAEFRLENGLPTWVYKLPNQIVIEKKIFMVHMQNTVHIIYDILECPSSFKFMFQPFFDIRHHEASLQNPQKPFNLKAIDRFFEIATSDLPSLFLIPSNTINFIYETKELKDVFYRIEKERGYDAFGSLKSPGFFEAAVEKGQRLGFTVSTEALDIVNSISIDAALEAENARRQIFLSECVNRHPHVASSNLAMELIIAADQFVIIPQSRLSDIAWTRALGEEARTIIAGYHWFNDWGRDTMISLEGLTLSTGRFVEAKYILQTFVHHLKDGLIPNMFPDKDNEGIYNTADATLWFFHALDRYTAYTDDFEFIKFLLPKIKEILAFHIHGTLFNIHVDMEDGLLVQGKEGYALTWMDAKIGNIIVTPRRGKAVEINALWFNALSLTIEWIQRFQTDGEEKIYQEIAKRCYESFNTKFWCEEKGYLFDVIEGENGNDHSCRPNQIFAISLKYPVLKKEYWAPVMHVVEHKLLTPLGLKTLSSDFSDYKLVYAGDLLARDMAYHQGTVWAWLIGPFIDAWLKLHPEDMQRAHKFLENFNTHFSEGCIGSINEIFDAEHPFIHRGCIAQAWSIAEILRVWIKTLCVFLCLF